MLSFKIISTKTIRTSLLCTLAFFGFSCNSEPASLVEIIKMDDLKRDLVQAIRRNSSNKFLGHLVCALYQGTSVI